MGKVLGAATIWFLRVSRDFTLLFAAGLLLAFGLPSSASAAFGLAEFGLKFTNRDGSQVTQAGSHPFAITSSFAFNVIDDVEGYPPPDGAARNLSFSLPRGVVGAPGSTPLCSRTDFVDISTDTKLPNCPNSSAIGVISLKVGYENSQPPRFISSPVYNLVPPSGAIQMLGFSASGIPIPILFTVSSPQPDSVIVSLLNLSQALPTYGGRLIVWGNPANPDHDSERGSCISTSVSGGQGESAEEEEEIHVTGESCPTNVAERPFLTLPRECSMPLTASFEVESWQDPGAITHGSVLVGGRDSSGKPFQLRDCRRLGFSPEVTSQVTNGAVQSPTGFDLGLEMESEGLTSPSGLAQADIKGAVVTLPEGLSINPPVAAGLGVCTRADLRVEARAAITQCPGSSKLGSVEIETPLFDQSLTGSLFLAQPDDPDTSLARAENPFDARFAIYMVASNPNLGIFIKHPLMIEADSTSGKLIARVDDLPQIPFSHIKLHFREGERALFASPLTCGTYATQARLVPRSTPDTVYTAGSSFRIADGVHHRPCPSDVGDAPFDPTLEAGTFTSIAGAHTPLLIKVVREDGSQPLERVHLLLPPGIVGALAGVPTCSDARIFLAERNAGTTETRVSSCPNASQVGTVNVGAGAGASPLYLQGRAYLAGPYRGASYSLAVVMPAVAGPFDLGTVVVRVPLYFDSRTAQILAVSDPMPTILSGIPLSIRSIALSLDRPDLVINPTNCDPAQFSGIVTSALGKSALLSRRFQVGACGSLDFKPKLFMRFKGPAHRGGHPRVEATVKTRNGEANLQRLAFELPAPELLESRHIRGVCSKSRFATMTCPPTSIYGHAKVWSPLLNRPLQGPVYLRSSTRRLPDLVASLNGQFQLDLAARVDSVSGRLRVTFNALPDLPLRRVTLTMTGGSKGLFVNADGLCKGRHRANAKFDAQNGKFHDIKPLVRTDCGKGKPADARRSH